MKFLITGGCGFVGSNLAAEVIKRNEELYIFDNLYRNGSEQNLEWLRTQGKFDFIHADIRNYNDIENAIKNIKPDVVFHLAGQVAMTTSLKNPRFDFEVNTLGTHNLLESIRKYSPYTIIIYSSTNKVYGDLEYLEYEETQTRYIAKDYPEGFDESLKLDFHSPYGCSKGAADQYLLDYSRMFGLNTIVFRHSSMYGGHQYATYDQGWIGWFCQKAIDTKLGILKDSFIISGNGKQVRDVLYIDDVVHCYFQAIKNIEITKGQVFNIGGGMENSLSLLELFEILEEKLDIKINYIKKPWRASDQKVFVANNYKISTFTGWKPKVTKEDGIERVLNWIKNVVCFEGE